MTKKNIFKMSKKLISIVLIITLLITSNGNTFAQMLSDNLVYKGNIKELREIVNNTVKSEIKTDNKVIDDKYIRRAYQKEYKFHSLFESLNKQGFSNDYGEVCDDWKVGEEGEKLCAPYHTFMRGLIGALIDFSEGKGEVLSEYTKEIKEAVYLGAVGSKDIEALRAGLIEGSKVKLESCSVRKPNYKNEDECEKGLSGLLILGVLWENEKGAKENADVIYKALKGNMKKAYGPLVMVQGIAALSYMDTDYSYDLIEKFLTKDSMPSKVGEGVVRTLDLLSLSGIYDTWEAIISKAHKGGIRYLNRNNENWQYILEEETRKAGLDPIAILKQNSEAMKWDSSYSETAYNVVYGNILTDIGEFLGQSNERGEVLRDKIIRSYVDDNKTVHLPLILGLIKGRDVSFDIRAGLAARRLNEGFYYDLNGGTGRYVAANTALKGSGLSWKRDNVVSYEYYKAKIGVSNVNFIGDMFINVVMSGMLVLSIPSIMKSIYNLGRLAKISVRYGGKNVARVGRIVKRSEKAAAEAAKQAGQAKVKPEAKTKVLKAESKAQTEAGTVSTEWKPSTVQLMNKTEGATEVGSYNTSTGAVTDVTRAKPSQVKTATIGEGGGGASAEEALGKVRTRNKRLRKSAGPKPGEGWTLVGSSRKTGYWIDPEKSLALEKKLTELMTPLETTGPKVKLLFNKQYSQMNAVEKKIFDIDIFFSSLMYDIKSASQSLLTTRKGLQYTMASGLTFGTGEAPAVEARLMAKAPTEVVSTIEKGNIFNNPITLFDRAGVNSQIGSSGKGLKNTHYVFKGTVRPSSLRNANTFANTFNGGLATLRSAFVAPQGENPLITQQRAPMRRAATIGGVIIGTAITYALSGNVNIAVANSGLIAMGLPFLGSTNSSGDETSATPVETTNQGSTTTGQENKQTTPVTEETPVGSEEITPEQVQAKIDEIEAEAGITNPEGEAEETAQKTGLTLAEARVINIAKKAPLLAVLYSFMVTGFGDFVSPAVALAKDTFGISQFVASLIPLAGFSMFAFSVPISQLQSRIGKVNVMKLGAATATIGTALPMFFGMYGHFEATNISQFYAMLASIVLICLGSTALKSGASAIAPDMSENGDGTTILTKGDAIKGIPIAFNFIAPGLMKHVGLDWTALYPISTAMFAGGLAVLSAIKIPETKPEKVSSMKETFGLLKNKDIALLAAAGFSYIGAEIGVLSTTPVMLTELGINPDLAGTVAFVTTMLPIILARTFAPAIINKLGRDKTLIASTISALSGLGLVLTGNDIAAITGLVLTGLGYGNIFPLLLGKAQGKVSDKKSSEITGVMLTSIVGGAIVSPVMGKLVDSTGVISGYIVPAACIVFIMGVAFREIHNGRGLGGATGMDEAIETGATELENRTKKNSIAHKVVAQVRDFLRRYKENPKAVEEEAAEIGQKLQDMGLGGVDFTAQADGSINVSKKETQPEEGDAETSTEEPSATDNKESQTTVTAEKEEKPGLFTRIGNFANKLAKFARRNGKKILAITGVTTVAAVSAANGSVDPDLATSVIGGSSLVTAATVMPGINASNKDNTPITVSVGEFFNNVQKSTVLPLFSLGKAKASLPQDLKEGKGFIFRGMRLTDDENSTAADKFGHIINDGLLVIDTKHKTNVTFSDNLDNALGYAFKYAGSYLPVLIKSKFAAKNSVIQYADMAADKFQTYVYGSSFGRTGWWEVNKGGDGTVSLTYISTGNQKTPYGQAFISAVQRKIKPITGSFKTDVQEQAPPQKSNPIVSKENPYEGLQRPTPDQTIEFLNPEEVRDPYINNGQGPKIVASPINDIGPQTLLKKFVSTVSGETTFTFVVDSDNHLHYASEEVYPEHPTSDNNNPTVYNGAAAYLQFLNVLKKAYKNVFPLNIGDIAAGNGIFNQMPHMISMLIEKFGYNVYVPGNHDGDIPSVMEDFVNELVGAGYLRPQQEFDPTTNPGVSILGQNIERLDNLFNNKEGDKPYHPYVVMNINDHKIGIIGQPMSGPGYTKGEANESEGMDYAENVIPNALKELKEKGVNYAIILAHQSPFDTRQALDDHSVYAVLQTLDPEYKDMVLAVFCGHNHGKKVAEVDGIPYIEVGAFYRNAVVAQVVFPRNKNSRPQFTYKVYHLGDIEITDQNAKGLANYVEKQVPNNYRNSLNVIIDENLPVQNPNAIDMGAPKSRLMANAIRAAVIKSSQLAAYLLKNFIKGAREKGPLSEDGSAIPEDRIIAVPSLRNAGKYAQKAGALTREDLAGSYPYPEYISVVKITGAKLIEFIKKSIKKDGDNYASVFAYSDNVLVFFDPEAEESVKVYLKTSEGIKPINPKETYYLATLNHMMRGFFEAGGILPLHLTQDIIFSYNDTQINDMMLHYFEDLVQRNGGKPVHISTPAANIINLEKYRQYINEYPDREDQFIISKYLQEIAPAMLTYLYMNKQTETPLFEYQTEEGKKIIFFSDDRHKNDKPSTPNYTMFVKHDPSIKKYPEPFRIALLNAAIREDEQNTEQLPIH